MLIEALLCSVAMVLAVPQQGPLRNPGDSHPEVPDSKVEEAIKKGIEFLKTAPLPDGIHKGITPSEELVLLTFISAGVPDNDPKFTALLDAILAKPLDRTYSVSLQAMCLEEHDRAKYQGRIYQCAQFLVDNVSQDGRWSYGEATPATNTPAPPPPKNVASGTGKGLPPGELPPPGTKIKPPITRKLPVAQTRPRSGGGDNSNSQYGALGMRACHDAGIVLPRDIVEKCRKSWLDCQHPAEKGAVVVRPPTASGGNAGIPGVPRGWCYAKPSIDNCEHHGPAFGSMTAGAIGAVCIYDYILGRPWKKEQSVADGMAWMETNWSVTENLPHPEGPKSSSKKWFLYYLYAMERVGMLYYSTHIGSHDWYKEGALMLLENQKGNGSWAMSDSLSASHDTCFAILFLKRATRPMVASGAHKSK